MIALDKQSAARLLRMIDSGLIDSRHTMPWCDRKIAELPEPPSWVLELAVSESTHELKRVVGEYVHGEPFESLDRPYLDRYELGCLFHRYLRRDLSWAALLRECADLSDAAEATPDCEWFYDLLNRYEESGCSASLESDQVELVRHELAGPIADVLEDYGPFRALHRPERAS